MKRIIIIALMLLLSGCGNQYQRVPKKESSHPIPNVIFEENGFIRDSSYDKECSCEAYVNGEELVSISGTDLSSVGKLLFITSEDGMSDDLETVIRELYGSRGATDVRYAITGLRERIEECGEAVCYMANPLIGMVIMLIWEKP